VNITTSDGIVHGQVRQSDLFSFVRIYESGHEVPFYQPLASLELFERVLNRKDIATGMENVRKSGNYKTKGTPTSNYREGNSTIVFEIMPSNATYNTAINGPDPTSTATAKAKRKAEDAMKRTKIGRLVRRRLLKTFK
jgi:hypothetical protein